MPTTIISLRRLRKKGMRYCVNQGQPPTVKFTNNPSVWVGGLAFLLAALVVFVTVFVHRFWFKGQGLYGAIAHAFHDGLWAGAAVALLYYLLPALTIFGFLLLRWKRPPRRILSAFSDGQKVVCLFLLAGGLVYGLNYLYPDVLYKLGHHRWPHHWLGVRPYVTSWWELGLMALGGAFILGVLTYFWLPEDLRPRKTRFKGATRHFLMKDNGMPFGLWLGRSTGRLSALWHEAGMAGGLDVVLSAEDAAQNILVLGGIGAGKTTRLMQPLLAQLLDQECGGLVFDVKGDVKKAALQLGEMAKWPITVIGPGHSQMNLLEGLAPEVAASFLKSAFLLSGGAKLDSFWVDTATELCRNTLGLLSFLPEHYTLQGLYSYLFDPEMKQVLQCKLEPLLETLGQAKIKRKTEGQTTGNSTRKWTEPVSKHRSTSQSITEMREPVLDAVLFRSLSADQAVALLSLEGRSMDDVLELLPLYV